MNHQDLIRHHNELIKDQKFGANNYGARHYNKWQQIAAHPSQVGTTHATGLVQMIQGALGYAQAHHDRYDSKIGDDGVLGYGWEQIIRGIRILLDGELGALNAGTCNSILCEALRLEGLSPEQSNRMLNDS